ncbi:MAG: DUF4114 domain-containing protein [Cyanobacteria bacterium P01_D01_bin.50]
MVDSKKVVKSVATATALTGAFVAPATAKAADNDAPNSIQETIQEASDAQKAVKDAPKKVQAAKKSFNNVKKEANREINKAKNLRKDAQKKATQEKAEAAKQNWNTTIITAQQKVEEAQRTRKGWNIKQAENWKQKAETARQTYENKKSEAAQKQEILQEREILLEAVTQKQNSNIEAAEMAYQKAQAEQQEAIQTASKTKKAADGAWGNWTKEHTVTDHLEDPDFNALIPQFQKLVQKERLAIGAQEVAAQRLDPTKLFLKHDHNVKVWFINEGAGYRNQLAYEATKGDNYDKGMIFNDIACKTGCQLSNGKNAPLDIGDFVDLGLIKGGTQLNFLLKADGARANPANGDIYGADESLNRDGLQHLMAFDVEAGDRNYLLMGFEDLRNGGDLDYNDAVFVVDFGEGNLTDKPGNLKLAQAAKVPEASNMAAILGITSASLMLRRRRRQKVGNKAA